MRTKNEWDEEFERYKQTGQLGFCPADPGPEREDWRVRRLYLACRLLTDRLETQAPAHLCSEAASRVGMATRQPGWAAMEGAWSEAMQAVFDEAWKAHELMESEMTHYTIEVTGRWANDKTSITKTQEVVFSARIEKEEKVSDEDDPE